jgi:hypothetical protein
VACQWKNYGPIKIQLASPQANVDLLDAIKRPSIAMDFDRAYPGDQGVRKEFIHATSQQVLEVQYRLPSSRRIVLTPYQSRAHVRLITHAYIVMTLMFLICHQRKLSFDSNLTELYSRRQLNSFFGPRLRHLLARLLMETLRSVLWDLERFMKSGRREDWPPVFVAMCCILFGVECFAVNIHIFEPKNADHMDERIEMEGVRVLLDRFKAYTQGTNPLDLDWSLPKNKEILQGDEAALMFSSSLQEVTRRYCECPVTNRRADSVGLFR